MPGPAAVNCKESAGLQLIPLAGPEGGGAEGATEAPGPVGRGAGVGPNKGVDPGPCAPPPRCAPGLFTLSAPQEAPKTGAALVNAENIDEAFEPAVEGAA